MAENEISKSLYQKTSRILLRLSLFCLITFAAISALGFKNFTSVLIGAGSFEFFDIFRGVTYVCFYFATVSFVPIMLLSSLALKIIDQKTKA